MRIILADDHRVVRNGLKLLLETQPNVQIIGEATNGEEVLAILEDNANVDVLLTDMNMHGVGGKELMSTMAERYPNVKVAFLSMVDSEIEIKAVFDLGAKAYLLKNADYDELLFALGHIMKGHTYLSSELSFRLLMSNRPTVSKIDAKQVLQELDLSGREFDVLQLLVDGHTTKEIADKLFISKRTVEGHRQKLLEKTNSKNYVELIRFSIDKQLIA